MSGVRPIETIVQAVLSEQAPTATLYNHFCMAELVETKRRCKCGASKMSHSGLEPETT